MSLFAEQAARLAAATGRLTGWPPAVFWAATPSEVAVSLGIEAPAARAVARDELDALRARFPDE